VRPLDYESKESPARPPTSLAREASGALFWCLASFVACPVLFAIGCGFGLLGASSIGMILTLLSLLSACSAVVHLIVWAYVQMLRGSQRGG